MFMLEMMAITAFIMIPPCMLAAEFIIQAIEAFLRWKGNHKNE